MTSRELFENCDHALFVSYTDDDERGVCERCGATCDWHYEKDSGNVGDYYWDGYERVPDKWYPPEDLKKNAESV